ncbi:MAG: virulence RhuM family protein, partial [Clostridiales Family XIII bacterium]|nr:virulence RhuM family protein [Clostridiales Family XIII bacterium]
NIFKTKELVEESVCSILEHTAADGKKYRTKFYNLDAIVSVGYRVNSINATKFRQWATSVLREYMLRGYAVHDRFERLERRMENVETKVDFFVRTALPPVEGIFYQGQIFDAYEFVSKLIKTAKKKIVLLDNYVDETILLLLSKRHAKVSAEIYTRKISKQLQLDLIQHNAQYDPIIVQTSNVFHDRFLIIDNMVYHIGASLKDLGKKLFAISKMEVEPAELLKNV